MGLLNSIFGKKPEKLDSDIILLRNQLSSSDWETLNRAANQFGELAKISPNKIIPVIPMLINDFYSQEDRKNRGGKEDRIASGAALAINNIAEKNPEILVPWLNDIIKFLDYTKTESKYEIIAKRAAVYVLGVIGSKKPETVIPILTQYLDDKDQYVKKNAQMGIQNVNLPNK